MSYSLEPEKPPVLQGKDGFSQKAGPEMGTLLITILSPDWIPGAHLRLAELPIK